MSNEGSTLPALACPLPSEGGGQIVLAHGGELSLHDRQPHGLVARIRIPLRQQVSPPAA